MRNSLLLILSLLAISTQAGATSLAYTGASGNNVGGYYVAPYFASVDGAPSIPVVCLDAFRHVANGDVWDVTVNSITSASLDFAPAFDKYKVAAVLWTDMQKGTVSYGDGQYAIWNLFNPTFSLAPAGQGALNAQTAAIQYVADNSSLNYSGITIYTPTSHGRNNNQYQEFLTGQVSTPEPGTFALLGGSLAVVAFCNRRRLRSANSRSAE